MAGKISYKHTGFRPSNFERYVAMEMCRVLDLTATEENVTTLANWLMVAWVEMEGNREVQHPKIDGMNTIAILAQRWA